MKSVKKYFILSLTILYLIILGFGFSSCPLPIYSSFKVDSPYFVPPQGIYSNSQDVIIASATPGATIRYTTDGNEPTESSQVFTISIPISVDITIKGRAYKDGMNESNTASSIFTFRPAETLIDDFESGDLSAWFLENQVTDPWGTTYPLAENDYPHLDAYEGNYLLSLYSAELYGVNTDLVSLYRDITVPGNAFELIYFWDDRLDDLGYGLSRIYIEYSSSIVADTGWFKGDKLFGPWKQGSFDVQSLRGQNIRLWIGIQDEGETFSGNSLLVDYIHFSGE